MCWHHGGVQPSRCSSLSHHKEMLTDKDPLIIPRFGHQAFITVTSSSLPSQLLSEVPLLNSSPLVCWVTSPPSPLEYCHSLLFFYYSTSKPSSFSSPSGPLIISSPYQSVFLSSSPLVLSHLPSTVKSSGREKTLLQKQTFWWIIS